MIFRSIPFFSLAMALAVVPAAACAQAVVQPLPGTTDADRLADQVHRLAVNPQDLDALVTAGALSIKLDDLTAAAAFFTRADKVDPRSARVKAGEASLLVRNERPGEALRYFAQAESYGLAPEAFAADRGLAYDLIGDQPRAQRDYRLALKQSPNDDETIRRYALSLGISGKQQQALDVLAPLLTKTDRGAWRSRAFVLAMNGDIAGAEHIATTMMPGGMAQGLQPFFARLPTLDPIDRAFAVHFGEVRTSPERLSDARLAPATTPLPPEPVAVAAVAPTPEPRKGRKDRRNRSAPVPAAPVQVAQAPVLPPIPTPRDQRPVYATTTAAPIRPTPPAVATSYPRPAASAVRSTPATPVVVAGLPTAVASTPVPTPPATLSAAAETPATLGLAPSSVASTRPVTAADATAAPAPVPTVAATSSTTSAGPIFGPSVAVVQAVPVTRRAEPQPKPEPAGAAPLPTPGFTALAGNATTRRPSSRRARSEDAVIDRIIAGLSIPASELDVGGKSQAAPVESAAADAKAMHGGRGRRGATPTPSPIDEPELTPAERKAADRKAAAAAKALAAKKAAAEEKAAADKEAAKQAAADRKAAKSNPTRIWVQVAGGANEDDLPKAWAAVKKKAPEAFAGRSGWATPLRATNRVLAGPFKTDADARAFVNTLKKSGVSGFAFTSDAGQKIEKLPSE